MACKQFERMYQSKQLVYSCFHIIFTDCFVLYFDRITCKTDKKENSARHENKISIYVNGTKSSNHVLFVYKVSTFDKINTVLPEIINNLVIFNLIYPS